MKTFIVLFIILFFVIMTEPGATFLWSVFWAAAGAGWVTMCLYAFSWIMERFK